MGNFHHEIGKKKLHYNKKSFGENSCCEKILGTLPSLSHALGTRGGGICVASVFDQIQCSVFKEKKQSFDLLKRQPRNFSDMC